MDSPDSERSSPYHIAPRVPAASGRAVADSQSAAPQPVPVEVVEPPVQEVRPGAPRLLVPALLFAATCWSTYFAGSLFFDFRGAILFSATLMATLAAHEFGHFIQARRYGVPASLPHFIPMPLTPLGTMGAFIAMRSDVADRRALFDIAITGPLAGLALAIPLIVMGFDSSHLIAIPEDMAGTFVVGEPLLFQWLESLRFGTVPEGYDSSLNPLLYAGWIGLFITGLNMIPVSQLDGGHVLYGLIGKRAHPVAVALWLAAVVAVVLAGTFVSPQYFGWLLMLGLVALLGLKHPPTADDTVPLGPGRVILGWIMVLFVVVGFTPMPIYVG